MIDFNALDVEGLKELAANVQNEIWARKEAAEERKQEQLKDSVHLQLESMPKELVYKNDAHPNSNYRKYGHFYNFALGPDKTDLNCDATILTIDCGELVYHKLKIFGFNHFTNDSIICDDAEKSNILNWMALVEPVYSELVEE